MPKHWLKATENNMLSMIFELRGRSNVSTEKIA
jgi:hypothetical protein